ncbi:hypothetical protein GUJ93_ZPchr0007g6093 [Zizania palustris]|uniref:DC1 domain-containing protein n=1 Tax=Zizania palustris TaxID=103762 RepID=A0A8J5T2C8_ZIZPA|nr:hypothetical protein GUJ93_ZPchr0007g6093 [Zizania palustris]
MTRSSKIVATEHHPHELQLMLGTEPFDCNGCKEKGYHLRYACRKKRCQFHLHEACAKTFGHLYQDPFKSHSMEFYASLPSASNDTKVVLCHGCTWRQRNTNEYVQVNGYVYAGKTTKKVLHPCCAALPAKIEAQGDVKLELRKKLSSRCRKCGRVKLGGKRHTWGYVSGAGAGADDVVQIHVACANELFHEAYAVAIATRPKHWVDSFMKSLKKMLSGAETSTTTTTEGSSRPHGGRVILPQLPAGVPASATTARDITALVQAVWWTVCTVKLAPSPQATPLSFRRCCCSCLHRPANRIDRIGCNLVSIVDYNRFLCGALELRRDRPSVLDEEPGMRLRMLIISRTGMRKLLNLEEVATTTTDLGFNMMMAEAGTDVSAMRRRWRRENGELSCHRRRQPRWRRDESLTSDFATPSLSMSLVLGGVSQRRDCLF